MRHDPLARVCIPKQIHATKLCHRKHDSYWELKGIYAKTHSRTQHRHRVGKELVPRLIFHNLRQMVVCDLLVRTEQLISMPPTFCDIGKGQVNVWSLV